MGNAKGSEGVLELGARIPTVDGGFVRVGGQTCPIGLGQWIRTEQDLSHSKVGLLTP